MSKDERVATVIEATAHLVEAMTSLFKMLGVDAPAQPSLPFDDYENVRGDEIKEEMPKPKKAAKKKENAEEVEGLDSPTLDPGYSLVDVRAFLAGISKGGKQGEVKSLLKEFGASKLTEIDPMSYGALMAKAKAL